MHGVMESHSWLNSHGNSQTFALFWFCLSLINYNMTDNKICLLFIVHLFCISLWIYCLNMPCWLEYLYNVLSCSHVFKNKPWFPSALFFYFHVPKFGPLFVIPVVIMGYTSLLLTTCVLTRTMNVECKPITHTCILAHHETLKCMFFIGEFSPVFSLI